MAACEREESDVFIGLNGKTSGPSWMMHSRKGNKAIRDELVIKEDTGE